MFDIPKYGAYPQTYLIHTQDVAYLSSTHSSGCLSQAWTMEITIQSKNKLQKYSLLDIKI
jgi:hypothetical protein